jgi:hypothetical protein
VSVENGTLSSQFRCSLRQAPYEVPFQDGISRDHERLKIGFKTPLGVECL